MPLPKDSPLPKRFAVLSRLLKPHEAALRESGFCWSDCTLMVRLAEDDPGVTLPIKASVFSRAPSKLGLMLALLRLGIIAGRKRLSFATAFRADGSPCTLAFPERPRVELIDDRPETERVDDAMFPAALDAYRIRLETFSDLTGLGIRFHHSRNLEVAAPSAIESGWIRLRNYQRPSGESGSRIVHRLFGYHPYGYAVLDGLDILKPARGRGVAVSDGAVHVAQGIGSDWYSLFPLFRPYNARTSLPIFNRLLAAVWESLDDAAHPVRGDRGKKAAEKVRGWIRKEPEQLAAKLVEYDAMIRHHQELIAIYSADRHRLQDMHRLLQDDRKRLETIERVPVILRRLRKIAGVAGVEFIDDGLHVLTDEMTMDWQGKTYRLGRFTVRLSSDGVAAVWCEDSPHPKGYSHPHVFRDDSPCFGNVRESIQKAALEHRYVDAVELIMKWLRRGYVPEQAIHKIEEWPEIVEIKDIPPIVTREMPHGGHGTEPRPAMADLRPEIPPSGHPDRSGIGGQPDGGPDGQAGSD